MDEYTSNHTTTNRRELSSCCVSASGFFGGSGGSTNTNARSKGSSSTNKNHKTFVGDDADLANDMMSLSFEEREKVFHDIHGVSELVDETPEFIQAHIQQLDACIAKNRHTNFSKARFLRPTLEHDRDFKLMFLRSSNYDPIKATKRMCDYFDKKCEMFGDDMLVKKLTIKDLNEHDLECQRSGLLMILPFKDRSGRPIVFFDFSKVDWSPERIGGHARWYWYIIMNAIENDATAQKRGVVSVSYAPGTKLLEPGSYARLSKLMAPVQSVIDAMPTIFSCTHMCYDDPRFNFMMQIIRMATKRDNRLRLRGHYGSPIEIEYSLLSFGIVSQTIFQRSRDGHIAAVRHDGRSVDYYIKERQSEEQYESELQDQREAETGIVPYPGPKDILIGRGQPYRNSPAALDFYKIIDASMDQYLDSTERSEKVALSIDVVKALRAADYRFLQRTQTGWEILDAVTARQKVAVAFRSRLPKKSSATSGEVMMEGGFNNGNLATSASKRQRVL